MVIHRPEAGHCDALAQSMNEMSDALVALPGCIGAEPRQRFLLYSYAG